LPRLKLTTQDEYTIREIILTDAGIPKQSSAPENIGDIVPQNIRLSPLPSDVVQKVPKARGTSFSSRTTPYSSSVPVTAASPTS